MHAYKRMASLAIPSTLAHQIGLLQKSVVRVQASISACTINPPYDSYAPSRLNKVN